MPDKQIIIKEVNHQLPAEGFVRLSQIVGDKTNPAIIPISKSSLWKAVREGRFPAPVHLGPRTTAWRVQDIRNLIEGMAL
jgi:prophage regulatory protein